MPYRKVEPIQQTGVNRMRRPPAQALPIAAIVLLLLVLVFGWLAGNLAESWLKIAAATAIPTVTTVPSATATPPPTLTPTPTSTSTATPTLTPTLTPLPTYTPYPTYTPFPTSTPVPCNPSRRDPATIKANLANSPDEARSILESTLRRWTRVDTLPRVGSPGVRFYLTFISPQVIEALVLDKSTRERVPADRRTDLLVEYDRRLYARNVFPFVLTWRGPQDRSLQVSLSPLDRSMTVVNQNRQAIPALSDYAPVFAAPVNMERGGAVGYVLFPRQMGSGCNPTINLAIDRSFDVRLSGISLSGFLSIPFLQNDQVTWSFDLLPDTSLEQALKIPLPRQAPEVEAGTMAEISGFAGNLIDGVLR